MADRTDFLGRLLGGLKDRGIRYCVLGGQGVNAYADPVVSLDLDLVIAVEQLPEVESWLRQTDDWSPEPVVLTRPEDRLAVPVLGVSVPIPDIYEGVTPSPLNEL